MAQSPSPFTTVPILDVRFRDERLTEPAIAARFVSFLEGLRREKALAQITERFGAEAAERALTKASSGNAFCSHIDDPSSRMAPADPDMPQLVDLVGRTDRERIDRRAKTLVRRIDAASGLKHLRKEHVQQLEPLRDGARLIRIELAAEI